jgi:hypothetical protein
VNTTYRAIVTHGGKPHSDEFLAVGLAAHKGWVCENTPIFRRDPTPEELEDQDVLVLDIGGRLEPEKGNFDHHQLPPERGECTLSILAGYLLPPEEGKATYRSVIAGCPWFRAVVIADTQGPRGLAALAGVEKLPPELLDDPFRRFLLTSWAETPSVWAAKEVFSWLFEQEMAKRVTFTKMTQEAAVASFGEGLQAIVVPPGVDPMVASAWMRENAPGAAASITPNDRGPGWKLYRVPGNEGRLDLLKLRGLPGVQFAHQGGFLAVFEGTREEAVEMLRRAGA